MAAKCFNCKKGIMVGHNVSHSKRRTRRIFKPNLHVKHIMLSGVNTKVRLCTRCIKLLKLNAKQEKARQESLAPQIDTHLQSPLAS